MEQRNFLAIIITVIWLFMATSYFIYSINNKEVTESVDVSSDIHLGSPIEKNIDSKEIEVNELNDNSVKNEVDETTFTSVLNIYDQEGEKINNPDLECVVTELSGKVIKRSKIQNNTCIFSDLRVSDLYKVKVIWSEGDKEANIVDAVISQNSKVLNVNVDYDENLLIAKADPVVVSTTTEEGECAGGYIIEDQNEGNIDDEKDIKQILLKSDKQYTRIEISTYDENFNISNAPLYLYFKDKETLSMLMIRAYQKKFEILWENDEHPGLYDRLKYAGVPKIEGNSYKMIFLDKFIHREGQNSFYFWYYNMDVKERVPDVENALINYSDIWSEDIYSCYKNEQDSKIENSDFVCQDQDGGKDYYQKSFISGLYPSGNIRYGEVSRGTDFCMTGNKDGYLFENYCDGVYRMTEQYLCPYGCSDGVCLPEDYEVEISIEKIDFVDKELNVLSPHVGKDTIYNFIPTIKNVGSEIMNLRNIKYEIYFDGNDNPSAIGLCYDKEKFLSLGQINTCDVINKGGYGNSVGQHYAMLKFFNKNNDNSLGEKLILFNIY